VKNPKNQRQFIDALENNYEACELRNCYIEWLENNNLYEEAHRQRLLPHAYKFLSDCASRWYASQFDDYSVSTDIEMQLFLNECHAAHLSGDYSFSCGRAESLSADLNSRFESFWKAWSIFTGIELHPNFQPDSGYFSCAC
jgi:hypothetical protein